MTEKKRLYHTLLIKDGGKWHVEFGDYDRELVQCEYDCWVDIPKYRKLIITTTDDQATIDKTIKELNSNESVL